MATSISYAAPDITSIATFRAYFQPLSNLLDGSWLQTTDTGQVVWVASSLTLSAVSVSGSNATYTYDGTVAFSQASNPRPRVGMSVTITGFTNANNNVTATITALGGSGASSTFTVTKVSQANETHAGTAVTTASALPGSGASVYEIWGPNDSLQTGSTAFYVRIDYKNVGGTTLTLLIQVGTSTNGSGTLTGTTLTQITQIAAPSTQTASCESNFSVGTSYLVFILNRVGNASGVNWICAIDRTRNTDGTISSDGVSIWSEGNNSGKQQTIVFSIPNTSTQLSILVTISAQQTTASTDPLNNQTPVFPIFPVYGKVGNPTVSHVSVNGNDFTDGGTFTATLYSATMTFLITKASNAGGKGAVGIRWE